MIKKVSICCILLLCSINIKAQSEAVKNGVYYWEDLPVSIGGDRETRAIMEGTSPHFEYLEIHATTQYPGAKPNKPNSNKDIEELIIVKEGMMKVTIEGKSEIVGPESVILFLPNEEHSIENVGDGNLTYIIMSYRSKKPINFKRGVENGGSVVYNAKNLTYKPSHKGGGIRYFDKGTSMCERFEMHITELNRKGPSHNPHEHIETEIILVLSGETEMMIDGKTYRGSAGDLYFANSKLLHGISNSSDKTCKYFAFKWY